MRASNGTDSWTPASGASCTINGMETASLTAAKCSKTPWSSAFKGTVVRRHHHQHGRAALRRVCTCDRYFGAKVRCGGDDGTRPSMCSRLKVSNISRSSSVKANCSEKLARMQMPSTPCETMQSKTRLIPSKSKVPSSLNGVGAIGKTPV